MFEIECKPFPPFNPNKELLRDKTCHIIEPYDDGRLMSISMVIEKDGHIMKIADKDGIHVGIDEIKDAFSREQLISILKITRILKLKKCQMFFSIKNEPILVDVFEGDKFISPGMLSDVYKNIIKTQKTLSTTKYNPDTVYNAIIKPAITCYENGNPIYLKDY